MWTLLVMGGLAPSAPSAKPWGADGHSIVCEIAFLELHENTRAKVRALMAGDPSFERFSDSCSWAARNPAHFVNFPRGAPSLDRGACTRVLEAVRHPCVVDAISDFAGALASDGPASSRLEALKFLAHFVGDLHQPLHAGYADDLGGNNVSVSLSDGSSRNLHSVWDSELIAMVGKSWQAYAAELKDDITPIDREQWADLDPFTWAKESYAIVENQVYDELPVSDSGNRTLDRDYFLLSRLVVERRLKQAGFRLARILEQVLGTNPS